MTYPENLKYTKDHEWVKLEGPDAYIGITDFAQSELGDVVYVELPEVGRHVKAGKSFGTVESVKAVSDLFMPLSGTVSEVNVALKDNPEAVNTHPHEKGWMIKIALSDPTEISTLLSATDYSALTRS